MSFIALPSALDGTPLHRRTYGSAITETYEEAEKWAIAYIERRKERLNHIVFSNHPDTRRIKRAKASFARLHQVIIYEDAGRVPVL